MAKTTLEDAKREYDRDIDAYRYVICRLKDMVPLMYVKYLDDCKCYVSEMNHNGCDMVVGVDLLTMENVAI